MSENLKYTKETTIDNIMGNYLKMEHSMVNQLYMQHDLHGGTAGGAREEIWRQMFETIVPKKFVIERSIFVIDSTWNESSKNSKNGISKEIDLAIIDEQYTPYIFRYGELKFVPIEAVAAVIECKSKSSNADALGEWSSRIDNLKTSKSGIARMVNSIVLGDDPNRTARPTQTGTRPLKIFCGLEIETGKHSGVDGNFDFMIFAVKETSKIEIKPKNPNWNLYQWHNHLNFEGKENTDSKVILDKYSLNDHYTVGGVSLLTFNFQLNQLLMIINNPMLFPHRAYVEMFNKGKSVENEKNCEGGIIDGNGNS